MSYHESKTDLPLTLVLTNAAFDDLFYLWVIHFVKAGWFYALETGMGNYILSYSYSLSIFV